MKQGEPDSSDSEKRVGNLSEVRGTQSNLLKNPNITVTIQDEHIQP